MEKIIQNLMQLTFYEKDAELKFAFTKELETLLDVLAKSIEIVPVGLELAPITGRLMTHKITKKVTRVEPPSSPIVAPVAFGDTKPKTPEKRLYFSDDDETPPFKKVPTPKNISGKSSVPSPNPSIRDLNHDWSTHGSLWILLRLVKSPPSSLSVIGKDFVDNKVMVQAESFKVDHVKDTVKLIEKCREKAKRMNRTINKECTDQRTAPTLLWVLSKVGLSAWKDLKTSTAVLKEIEKVTPEEWKETFVDAFGGSEDLSGGSEDEFVRDFGVLQ
jgi:hypothetical protein